MKIMSVDLGLARTGVAVSDESGGFAFPKCVITEYNKEKLIEKIIEIAKAEKAGRIVVGLPVNMDGSRGERAETCTEIAKEIKEKGNIETVLWDERGTTITAHNYLNENNVRGKKRKQTVDAVAATIILEDYLRSL
ncbi:MAG: Holliday junction resolvase RuvX [Clostridia bacterium]|nr:Holliday junction resolvase RuvX [Clostridia bacterium]